MIERKMDEQTWRNLNGAESLLMSNALDRYLNEVSTKKRPRSADRDRLSASYLHQSFGSLTLAQITPDKVASYRDKRLKKVSPHSVRIELALLSHLFNIARKEWAITGLENPVSAVKKPQIPEGRCPMLTNEQIERLLSECKKSRSDYLYPFCLLQLHTGCRSSELRGLRWSQVDLEEGFISLIGEDVKNHRRRSIPLTPAAIDVLKYLLKEIRGINIVDKHTMPDGLVFPARGRPNKPRDMHMAFDRAVRRASLDNLPGAGKLRIHDLRHLCGSYLLMKGSDLKTVQEVLGHRDISTTQKYTHIVNEHKKKMVLRISNLGLKNSD
jgi:integrase